MKTTGVLPEALAASISRFSRSEIDAIPEAPFGRGGKPGDPGRQRQLEGGREAAQALRP
jgi:hypothetical protein